MQSDVTGFEGEAQAPLDDERLVTANQLHEEICAKLAERREDYEKWLNATAFDNYQVRLHPRDLLLIN